MTVHDHVGVLVSGGGSVAALLNMKSKLLVSEAAK